jgi:hypothetical protein
MSALRLPPKPMQRTMLSIAESALEDGGRSAHFGNPKEKAAVRMLARGGHLEITSESRTELYAKLTPAGQALLAALRAVREVGQ